MRPRRSPLRRQAKHVICEKPREENANESSNLAASREDWRQRHVCVNYRFVPVGPVAREMLEAGELGEMYHFRRPLLQEWIVDPQFSDGRSLTARSPVQGA